jgi:integrase
VTSLYQFVGEYFTGRESSLSSHYQGNLRRVMRQFEEWAGAPVMLADLDERVVNEFLAHYGRDHSPTSVNNARRMILTLWGHAYDYDLVPRQPKRRRIVRFREEERIPEAWTLEECNKIFSVCASLEGVVCDIRACDWWLSLTLAVYATGCRITAMLGSKVADYVPHANVPGLFVRRQKNRRELFYALPAWVREVIDRVVAAPPRELIWPWHLHRNTLWGHFRRIIRAAGVPAPAGTLNLFHRLRRTCISYCDAASPAIAQRQADHESYKTTRESYVDPRISGAVTAADVLPPPSVRDYRPPVEQPCWATVCDTLTF